PLAYRALRTREAGGFAGKPHGRMTQATLSCQVQSHSPLISGAKDVSRRRMARFTFWGFQNFANRVEAPSFGGGVRNSHPNPFRARALRGGCDQFLTTPA